jgi:cell division protein FtsB
MNVWLTIYRAATVIFIVMVVVAVISLFLPKIRQNQERQRKVAVLEEDNRTREDGIKQLQRQQEQFLSDPKAVERVAREDLGKAKAGEMVYRFTDRKTNDYRMRRGGGE